jgi:iron(II)-dependent oxidoreductase
MMVTTVPGAESVTAHPGGVTSPAERATIAADLERTKRRTDQLLGGVDDARLATQHDPLLSPPVWDYAHVGAFEELWLVRALDGGRVLDPELDAVYNALETPRTVRGHRRMLNPAEARTYRTEVRRRVLALLEEADLDSPEPLLHRGFAYDLVLQHEEQHAETLCQTLQLMPGGYLEELPELPGGRPVAAEMVDVAAGTYPIGSDAEEPYDNEHPRHLAELPGFRIDRFPVSCADQLSFMEDGGYSRRELWSPDGWEWVTTFGIEAPEYWERRGAEWMMSRFGVVVPVDPGLPLMHVSYFEAEAHARWRGARLPTETEWEVAASWDPALHRQRRHPWGDEPASPQRANLDRRLFSPAPLGSFPGGRSALGCEQMEGDVWEWTSSDFAPHPGFRAFPYPEYSEPFFGGGFKVLRGGSWATAPRVARATFRNWDSPLRRQIFSGFRCAQDAVR